MITQTITKMYHVIPTVRRNLFKIFCILLLFCCTQHYSFAQLHIQLFKEPAEAIPSIFVKESGGIEITDCKYIGHPQAVGYFTNRTELFGIPQGLVLSTGFALTIATPNTIGNSSASMGTPGDFDLSLIARGKTYDAAIILLEFISHTDSVAFKYFFGSEEYPEYLDKGVNDVFAFFIRKKGSKSWRNIAFSPSGFPISIDNINHIKNSEYYIPNNYYSREFQARTTDQNQMDLAACFTFDGFTIPMQAISKVEAGVTYELKIAIADVGDDLYDSGVFLAANSFQALNYFPKKGIALTLPAAISKLSGMNQLFSCTEENKKLIISLFTKFSFDSYQIDSLSMPVLDTIISQLQTLENKIVIYGHTDSIGTEKYNQELSLKRSQTIAKYLITNGISSKRIETKAMGSTRPKESNETDEGRMLNRRVEIEIDLSEF